MGEDERDDVTYTISPVHTGKYGKPHVDVTIHDSEGNVVGVIKHVWAEVDGDSHTVNYVDVDTGKLVGSSSWDNTYLHTGNKNKEDE